jgi:Family of unknown function (DUF6049)
MQTVRSVVRTLSASIALLLAVAGPLLAAVPPVQASAGQIQQQSDRTVAASSRTLAVSITGMTPTVASSSATITVTGTLTNRTGAAVAGIAVQAWTSTKVFAYPEQMTEFTTGTAAGTSPLPLQPAGQQYQVPESVPNGASVRWSVSFQAGDFYYGQFGVYPVQVQASAANTGDMATARTFLPFWPGGTAAAQPKGLQVAWVWPLIDTPQQGACGQTLATSRLAGSVAAGGRLSTLLGAGSTWDQDDHLTWAIDPALLSDVSVMTGSSFTLGSAACSGRFEQPPSAAAAQWLSQLKTATAGAPAFLTPYANVDVAALSHSGLDGILRSAYQVGDAAAGQILPNTFGAAGSGTVLRAAWPPDGIADAEVVTSLASDGGIGTVVLDSDHNQLPASSVGEDALARTTSGIGTSVSVLLANSRITSLLGSASPTASPADQFALTQDFLAQTAMIAAELPAVSRSLVIAPPTGWDPSAAEASALLSVTAHDAPWLHPADLSALSAQASKLPATQLHPKQVSRAELSASYVDHLEAAQDSLSLFTDLLYQPPARTVSSLQAALAAAASSAWRGAGSPGGWLAITRLTDYLHDSQNKVRIIAGKKILLAGTSGTTPVSVQNGLGLPVQVRVVASPQPGSQLEVGQGGLFIVQPGKTYTDHMSLHAATIGTSTLQLQLVTKNGSPLASTAQSLSVEVTRFGRFLLIIIGAALGILVLTSAFRLQRKRKARAAHEASAAETVDVGGAG